MHRRHIHLVPRQAVRHIAQQTVPVLRAHFDVDGENLPAVQFRPAGRHHFFGRFPCQVLKIRATFAVNRHAFFACDKAGNQIGRRGFAAACQHGQQPAFAVHQHAVSAAGCNFGFFDNGVFRHRHRLRFNQRAGGFLNRTQRHLALTDGGIQFLQLLEAEFFAHLLLVGLGIDFGDDFVELVLAFLAHGFGILRADIGADFADGLRRFDPAFVQPVHRRLAFFGGDDFHALPVFQRRGQRHNLPVHLRATATVAQIAVQRIGKIDRCGTRRQREHFAVRRQHINRVVEQFGFEGGGQIFFAALRHVFAPVQQLAQPGDFLFVGRIALAAFFIAPVRRHTEFVEFVHFVGADLHFDAFVFRSHNHGVQAFVAVAFRVSDIVVELARNRLPQAVDDAEHGIAFGHGIDQHAHGADVVQAVKIQLFLHHFAVNGIDVLGAAGHVAFDAGLADGGFQLHQKAFDIFQPLIAFFVEQAGDAAVFFGIVVAEAQIFELPFELPHAQTVGQRGENIQRFFGQGAFGGAVGRLAEKLHGAGTQGELNQDDADVGHHGQQHFAHGFGLGGTLFGRGQAVHFGKMGELLHFVDTFDQIGHGGTARFGYTLFPVVRMRRCVSQYGGGDGLGQQIHIGHHQSSLQQMRQQRFLGGGGGTGRINLFCQLQSSLQHSGFGLRLALCIIQVLLYRLLLRHHVLRARKERLKVKIDFSPVFRNGLAVSSKKREKPDSGAH